MKIQASELHRLLYNAILFTDKKSAAGGVAALVVGPDRLGITATDDHVAVMDYASANKTSPKEASGVFYLPLVSMKVIEKELRDWDGELELDLETYDHLFRCRPVDSSAVYLAYDLAKLDDPELWDTVGRMLSLSDFVSDDSLQHVTFGLNPDRLRKFSLIRPGNYPIDMRYGYDCGVARDVIAFKAGPTLRGVLAPLDRRLLKEKYGPEAGSVMW